MWGGVVLGSASETGSGELRDIHRRAQAMVVLSKGV